MATFCQALLVSLLFLHNVIDGVGVASPGDERTNSVPACPVEDTELVGAAMSGNMEAPAETHTLM